MRKKNKSEKKIKVFLDSELNLDTTYQAVPAPKRGLIRRRRKATSEDPPGTQPLAKKRPRGLIRRRKKNHASPESSDETRSETNSKPKRSLIRRRKRVEAHPTEVIVSESEAIEIAGSEPARRQKKIKELTIDVYDGYGNSELLCVKGRLFSKRGIDDVEEDDSRLRNLVNTSKRFMTNEAEAVWVKVQLGEHINEVLTDREGIFQTEFEQVKDMSFGVHTVTVTLSERNAKPLLAQAGTGHFILHPVDSDRLGIISDIDDTILRTGATSKAKLLRNVFLSNYKTQGVVDGMSRLYHAIHYGPHGDGYDATHYVSSSPDNLYSRINAFLDYRQFPAGSIDLKNIGLRKGSDSLFDHEKYKFARIKKILETYPKRRFVLFGDSGEHDPEIYRKISQEYRDQILAIYIHNVSDEDPFDARFEGQLLFSDPEKVKRDLVRRALIYPDTDKE